MRKYSILWRTFKKKDFAFEEARKILKEKNQALVSIILSELRKNGWLTIKLHPEDSRKRIYTLKNPEEAVTDLE
ncbi:MAG: hypothetical protein QXR60_04780 [Candidatus Nanoarchaeia archaeon]